MVGLAGANLGRAIVEAGVSSTTPPAPSKTTHFNVADFPLKKPGRRPTENSNARPEVAGAVAIPADHAGCVPSPTHAAWYFLPSELSRAAPIPGLLGSRRSGPGMDSIASDPGSPWQFDPLWG